MRNAIKVSLTILLTICLVSGVARLFHSNSWYPKMNEFYKTPEDYEVWFMGSSHAIMSTLPEELWKDYGIRAYNLACYGQSLALDYWIAKNLFRIHKPKLIVADVGSIADDEIYTEANIGSVKKMVDSLPLSIDKLKMIDELFKGKLKEELLIPFASDHYNWEYLTKDYFVYEEAYDLGADQNVFNGRGKENYILVSPTKIPGAVHVESASEFDSLNFRYFIKLIELCEENDVELMLTKCPLNAKKKELENYAYGFKIGQEHGLKYFDGFATDSLFDGDTDMWDKRHLNSLGARKFTKELGKFITSNYPEVETTADAGTTTRWDSRYEKYLDWLDSEFALQTNMYSYLMLCTHPQYSVEVEMEKGGPVDRDIIAHKLIASAKESRIKYGELKDSDIHIKVFNEDGTMISDEKFRYKEKLSTVYKKVKKE